MLEVLVQRVLEAASKVPKDAVRRSSDQGLGWQSGIWGSVRGFWGLGFRVEGLGLRV